METDKDIQDTFCSAKSGKREVNRRGEERRRLWREVYVVWMCLGGVYRKEVVMPYVYLSIELLVCNVQ